ncbi:OsmC family protein [Corallococcus soli]|uniref:OsmC family protein n=1 Tax=Corallococcus soli TaxID=2710757 RepID=UPI001D036DCE|nr:hypothetical protein [Corallococcus soli]
MTSISITEYETRLYWQGERGAVLTSDQAPPVPIGPPMNGVVDTTQGGWAPEALLLGAVEGRALQAFLDDAREAGVRVLFYQSTAMARLVSGGPEHAPCFTDLIVRPHVAVASPSEAERARQLFAALPMRCFPSSMLHLTPRIEAVVEVWAAHRSSLADGDGRASLDADDFAPAPGG